MKIYKNVNVFKMEIIYFFDVICNRNFIQAGLNYFYKTPGKRQSLIPFPRVGKRSSAFNRRILRSAGDGFKRRITRRSWWNNDGGYSRRISRSAGYDFHRRLIKRSAMPHEDFDHQMLKRQSLIPFPRTGKRSTIPTNKELDQFYIYENNDDDDNEDYDSGAEKEDDDEYDVEEDDFDDLGIPRCQEELLYKDV